MRRATNVPQPVVPRTRTASSAVKKHLKRMTCLLNRFQKVCQRFFQHIPVYPRNFWLHSLGSSGARTDGGAQFHGPQTKEGRREYDNLINPFWSWPPCPPTCQFP